MMETVGILTAEVLSIQPRVSLVLDLPPSCVEFSTVEPAYFVVGTYSLEENQKRESRVDDGEADETADGPEAKLEQQRSGTLVLCRLVDENV